MRTVRVAHPRESCEIGAMFDAVTEYINDCARPHEPWYVTVRRLAPLLVVENFDADARGMVADIETRGTRLLDAIAHHATQLSLPKGCNRPDDVLPEELRAELRVPARLAEERRAAREAELVERRPRSESSVAKTRSSSS